MENNTITVEELLKRYTFENIGSFYLEDNKLKYNINSGYENITNFVYLLKTETENLYLGSFTGSIKNVLYNLKQGNKDQVTYHNIKNKLIEKLKEIKNIDIFICKINDNIPVKLNTSWNKGAYKMINDTKKIKKIIEKNNIEPLDNLYHNRIIYGAPGTGKSFKLKKEIENSFENIEREYELILDEDSLEENLEEKEFYNCGFIWGKENKKNEFIENNIWINGHNTGNTLKYTKNVNVNDILFLKTSFTKKMRNGDIVSGKQVGDYYSVSRVFAIGKVLENNGDGINLKVQWKTLDKDYKEYPNVFLSGTIKKISDINIRKKLIKDWGNLLNSKEFEEEKEYEKEIISTVERVTFYDGYTYGQFVGTYKPTPMIKEDGTETITYKYVPGPFMKQLVKAYNDEENNYCLVIEEINRAKADRVFGNIFQLLDRDTEGKSEYPIMPSEDQLKYLKDNLDDEIFHNIIEEGLFIPKNLYLWATMNSADQGVYPMDSAFKRRWSFEHIGLDEHKYEELDNGNIPGICFRKENGNKYIVSWNNFRKVINETLLENKVLEDRLLAPYFIKKESFNETLGNIRVLNETVFIDKILMYLFDDILKHKNNNILFKDNINSFSQMKDILKEKTEEKENITVFNEKIIIKLEEAAIELNESLVKEEKGNILYKNFWENFNEYLKNSEKEYPIFSNKSRTPSTDNWQERQIPNVFGYEVVLKLSYTKKIISTEIYMNKENAKELFDKAYSHKEEIEKSLGFNLQWFNKENNSKVAYKAYLSKNLDINNQDLWEEASLWLIKNSEKIAAEFKKYI